jgi:hypothetical protein
LQARYILPQDLAGALRHLSDSEIDALLAAALVEARRRDRPSQNLSKQKAADDSGPPDPRLQVQGGSSLTTGKQNAVRAAFRAGVKPSAIARQFGLSNSDVAKILAQGPKQKSGR